MSVRTNGFPYGSVGIVRILDCFNLRNRSPLYNHHNTSQRTGIWLVYTTQTIDPKDISRIKRFPTDRRLALGHTRI
ncbi:hypothetical protein PSAB6_70081 [Paraburkholderia sabiae]|nr:hypothetical protein PSAB6_70081 [Paraburkholderia sabiae]